MSLAGSGDKGIQGPEANPGGLSQGEPLIRGPKGKKKETQKSKNKKIKNLRNPGSQNERTVCAVLGEPKLLKHQEDHPLRLDHISSYGNEPEMNMSGMLTWRREPYHL